MPPPSHQPQPQHPTPYPTAAEIRAIFELENGPQDDREAFLSHVDEHFQLKVISEVHPFPRTANKEEYGHIMHMQQEWMHGNDEHPYEKKVGVVTGGGENEWVAVEVFNHGRTKAGQDYKANYLFLTRFNRDRKMIEMKVFLDSHQFHTTKEHVTKGHLPGHKMSDRDPR